MGVAVRRGARGVRGEGTRAGSARGGRVAARRGAPDGERLRHHRVGGAQPVGRGERGAELVEGVGDERIVRAEVGAAHRDRPAQDARGARRIAEPDPGAADGHEQVGLHVGLSAERPCRPLAAGEQRLGRPWSAVPGRPCRRGPGARRRTGRRGGRAPGRARRRRPGAIALARGLGALHGHGAGEGHEQRAGERRGGQRGAVAAHELGRPVPPGVGPRVHRQPEAVAPQVLEQRLGRRVAPLGLAGERAQHDRIQVAGELAGERRGQRRHRGGARRSSRRMARSRSAGCGRRVGADR
jgi:hypothetical protein